MGGIVPGPGQKLDGGNISLAVIGGHDAFNVAEGQPGGHGIASVGNGLDGTFFAPRQLVRKIRGSDDDQYGVTTVDGIGNTRGVGKHTNALQSRRGFKVGGEVDRFGAFAHIQERVRGAVQIKGGAVAKEESLNENGNHKDAAFYGVIEGD